MRFVPTRIHGVVDYLTGAFLIIMPWLLGFARGGAETWIPVVIGAGIVLQSVFTDYELGVIHKLGMRPHLGIDAATGAFLGISPWLFGFAELVFWPFVIVGAFELVMSLVTKTRPYLGESRHAESSRAW